MLAERVKVKLIRMRLFMIMIKTQFHFQSNYPIMLSPSNVTDLAKNSQQPSGYWDNPFQHNI